MGSILKEYKEYQLEIEEKYGNNSIVFLMVGSFYEIYGVNTENLKFGKVKEVSKILNILMTRKDKSKKHDINNPYLCGFPVHSLGKHLHKLLNNNFTIGIYDQFDIENSKKKMRKLVNVYSPSTYIDSEIRDNTELMAIYIESYKCPIQKRLINSCHITSIDLSTGKNRVFTCTDTKDNPSKTISEIKRLLHVINPCEILVDKPKDLNLKSIFTDKLVHYKNINKKFFNLDYQNNFIKKIFNVTNFSSPIEFIELEKYNELCACYLYLLQFAYEHDSRIIKKIQKPEFLSSSKDIIINNDAIMQLNLTGNKQSLLNVIDFTYTKMGKRLLKSRISSPIFDEKILNERYDFIENLINDNKYIQYQKYLKYIGDIEKKYRKLVLQRLHPYEFARLKESFVNIEQLLKLNNNELLEEFVEFYKDYNETFNVNIMEKYNLQNIKSTFFNSNINAKIDNIYSKINKINENLVNIAKELSKNIDNNHENLVRLESNEKDGYYFYTTKKRWELLNKKEDFIIKFRNTFISKNELIVKKLTNGIRIFHPLLDKNWIRYCKLQKNNRVLIKNEYLAKLKYYDMKYNNLFTRLIKFISEIDIYSSCAKAAVKYSYIKPVIKSNSRSYFDIKNIRHPLIERIHDDIKYVRNNITLNNDTNGILLYGINAGGKSSLLRAVGSNIILAQIGMYVSAESFEYKPFKHLLTKIGSNDDIFKGQSTFVVEMLELKKILKISNENSLILCDELTSGTETSSATGIVASTLLTLLKKKTNYIFTTHLHGLMKFNEITSHSKLKIYHFKISIEMGNISYKYKLEEGSGDTNYGIEIAKVIGLDKEFIKESFKFRNKFNNEPIQLLSNKRSRYNNKIIVDQCSRCGSKHNLHTHHIEEQHRADSNGIIEYFPKNIKHNLDILCEKCHIKEHSRQILTDS